MRCIKECESWQELAKVVKLHGRSFNERHTSAGITHLAQLSKSAFPLKEEGMILYEQLLSELLDLFNASLFQCGARQLANVLWAITHLSDDEELFDSPTSQSLVNELHSTAANIMPLLQPLFRHCEPQHFSNISWAAAKLGLEPDDEWLEGFLIHSEQCLANFQPQHLGNTIWGLARLGVCPDHTWISAFLSSVEKQKSALVPIDISHILLGLATLEFDPHHPQSRGATRVIHALLESLLPPHVAHKASPQAVANCCWALATMKFVPCSSWTERLVMDFDRKMVEYSDPQALSTILWSLATMELGSFVPPDTMQRIYEKTLPILPSFEPRSLSNTIWAIASFLPSTDSSVPSSSPSFATLQLQSFRPPNEWAANFLSCFQRQLPLASDQATSNVMWAIAKLKISLEPEIASLMIQHLHSLDSMDDERGARDDPSGLHPGVISGQSLSNSLWALAKLGFRLSPDAQTVLISMVDRRLTTQGSQSNMAPLFRPSELASVLYSFAVMTLCPPPAVVSSLLSNFARYFIHPGSNSRSSLSPRDLSNISWSIATLGLEPGEPFMQGFWLTASQSLSSFKPKDLAQTTYSLAKMKWSVVNNPNLSSGDQSASDLLLSQAIYTLPHCSSQDISNLSWGLAQMDLKPSQAWCLFLADLLCQRGDALLASDLATSFWALGKMQFRPKPRSLMQIETSLYRKIPSLKPRELAACAWSFSAMKYTPDLEWLDSFAQQCMLIAAEFSQQDWTVVVYSLASIAEEEKDAVIYLEDLFISPQLEAQMSKFTPNTIAMLTYSCGVLGTKSARLLGRLLAAARPHLSLFKANELCALICTPARLKICPDEGFLSAWLVAFEQRIPTLPGSALSTSVWALASLGVSPRAEWQRLLAHVLEGKLDSLESQEVSMVVWALGEWVTPLPPLFVARLGSKVGSFNKNYSKTVRRNLNWALMKLKSKSKAAVKRGPWEKKTAEVK